jgi:hypothetical protein
MSAIVLCICNVYLFAIEHPIYSKICKSSREPVRKARPNEWLIGRCWMPHRAVRSVNTLCTVLEGVVTAFSLALPLLPPFSRVRMTYSLV